MVLVTLSATYSTSRPVSSLLTLFCILKIVSLLIGLNKVKDLFDADQNLPSKGKLINISSHGFERDVDPEAVAYLISGDYPPKYETAVAQNEPDPYGRGEDLGPWGTWRGPKPPRQTGAAYGHGADADDPFYRK